MLQKFDPHVKEWFVTPLTVPGNLKFFTGLKIHPKRCKICQYGTQAAKQDRQGL